MQINILRKVGKPADRTLPNANRDWALYYQRSVEFPAGMVASANSHVPYIPDGVLVSHVAISALCTYLLCEAHENALFGETIYA